nr:putative reverse transcriptase domain-containing protein [Tanacetum cinerariifolium]
MDVAQIYLADCVAPAGRRYVWKTRIARGYLFITAKEVAEVAKEVVEVAKEVVKLQNLLPSIVAQVGNHVINQGNNGNQDHNVINDNTQGNVMIVNMNNDRGVCSYKEFFACHPKDYNGTGAVIVYTRLIEKMESVHDMSRCGDNQKVKYTEGLFIGKALTWWNSQVQTRGREAAIGMTWEDFKIHGIVAATEPTIIQSAILKAGVLTDEAVRNGALKRNTKKRWNSEELNPSKIKAVKNWEAPRTPLEGEEQEREFQTLKDKMCNTPVLALLDRPKEFMVYYDASGLGLVCVLMQRGSWDVHLPLVEFSYNNNYHYSVRCAPFEALYERKCRSPILWAEVEEGKLIGPRIMRKPLEFIVGDHVLLKVSPWKGVVSFGKKGKLAPKFVRPFENTERIGLVAYRLRLPQELNGVHDTFHMSNLKKCLADPALHIHLEEI